MAFAVDRTDIEARFREVRSLLSYIKAAESDETPPADSEEVKILRGLYFVHLYGAFEKSTNESFQAYLRGLSSLRLSRKHTAVKFWPTAFDSHFKSVQTTFSEKQWKKRRAFIEAIEEDAACEINDGAFADQLQNVWIETITDILGYLGLAPPDWQEGDARYLDEIVNKRNQVAHGRTSPLSVGSSGRSSDLQIRFEAVYRIMDALIRRLEDGHQSLPYVRDEFRPQYSFDT